MSTILPDLFRFQLAAIAERCAKEAKTTVEAMFSPSRARRNSAARAAFYQELHDGRRWTIKKLAELTGRSEWTVHSAVYQSPRRREYEPKGYPRSRVRAGVEVSRFDERPSEVRIAQVEDLAQVPRGELAGSDRNEQGAAGADVTLGGGA